MPFPRDLSAHAAILFLASAVSAQGREFPYSMDFGPYLMTTFDGRGLSEFTYKGVVVKLGDQGAVAFDTELLRLSAAWTDGWLQLRGTAYDGAHGPTPSLRGHKIAETRPLPGWARDGEFGDPRAVPYGPLPKDWGAYRGLWLHGNEVVVGYTVGGMEVKEGYAAGGTGAGRYITRTLELGPCAQERVMVALEAPADAKAATVASGGRLPDTIAQVVGLCWQPAMPDLVGLDDSTASWDELWMGAPSAADYLDAASGTGATVQFVPEFARVHGAPAEPEDAAALDCPKLRDGVAAQNNDDPANSTWFDKRKVGSDERDDGRFHADLRAAVEVSRISTFSWHRGGRSEQEYTVFGSAAETPPPLAAADPAASGWSQIAAVDSGSLGRGDRHGVTINRPGTGLGTFRHLLFVVRRGSTFFSELDVYAGRFRAAIDASGGGQRCALAAVTKGAELRVDGSRLLMCVPPHRDPLLLHLVLGGGTGASISAFHRGLEGIAPPAPLSPKCHGGRGRWGEPLVTKGARAADDGDYVVDTATVPFENRFGSRMRTAAFDFFRDGRAAVSTWNGDVFVVSGLDDDLDHIEWKRFATGLFDPLGLRIVDDAIYVHGRDGITRLHDLDGDGEADFYECFNHDVAVTSSFHEFAFDLQTDAEGNFYCSKGGPVKPGGRGFTTIAPHHGAILKIQKDGSKLEVYATGLRAPNGIGVSSDGVVTSGDNEGTWVPRCRINWMPKPGFYAGVKATAHRASVPDEPDLPLCWMPMDVDNSSGGQAWVQGDRWGPLQGRLLHLSYGTCSLYLVHKEEVDGQVQGGVVRFPCSFSSSAMRARFHPVDGQLWVIGFQGWQTSAAREGGFHRVRYTGKPVTIPTGSRTCERGVYLTFAQELDQTTATDPDSYGVEIWNYLYSQNYGSPEISLLHPERTVEQGKPNRDPLPVRSATLSPDGRTVFLEIEGMRPVHQMKVTWNVDAKAGGTLQGALHCSIHRLARDPGFGAR